MLKNPHPKLFCLVRDPRAIFLSQKTTIDPYSKKHFNTNPLITAYYWIFFTNFLLKSNCFKIQYESLIINYQNTLNELIKELEINNPNQIKEPSFFELLPTEQKKLHKIIEEPPQKSHINKWEAGLTRIERFLIEKTCRENMNSFDYPTKTPMKKPLIATKLAVLYFKIRIFFKIDVY